MTLTMTLTYDTLLYNDSLPIHDLTSWRLTAHQWRRNIQKATTCWWLMLMTWRLTFTVYVTWCPLTHYVLMTLTYNTLLYNDSLPIHDLTSWRLTTQRWLDLTWKHPLHVSDSCLWFDIWHSLRVDDTMSGYAQRVDDFDIWHCSTRTWLNIQTFTVCWWLMLMTWRLTFTVYCDLMSAHSLCVDDFDVWHPALQWLTAHPWLNVSTSHCSPVTWLDIQKPSTCWWLMLMIWHLTFTVRWWLDE